MEELETALGRYFMAGGGTVSIEWTDTAGRSLKADLQDRMVRDVSAIIERLPREGAIAIVRLPDGGYKIGTYIKN